MNRTVEAEFLIARGNSDLSVDVRLPPVEIPKYAVTGDSRLQAAGLQKNRKPQQNNGKNSQQYEKQLSPAVKLRAQLPLLLSVPLLRRSGLSAFSELADNEDQKYKHRQESTRTAWSRPGRVRAAFRH